MNPSSLGGRRQRTRWSLEELRKQRALLLGFALAPSSRLAYSTALRSYHQFCELHNFPEDPTPETLSLYISWQSTYIEPRTIGSYLSGIASQLESVYPHVRVSRNHPLVVRALKGAKRLYSKPVHQKRALSISDFESLLTKLPLVLSHDLKLFLAILFTGFFGLHRLSELLYPDNIKLRDPRKLMLRSTFSVSPSSYSGLLPGHKADSFFTGHQILIHKRFGPVNPVFYFSLYLSSRDLAFPGFLPLWLRADGSIPTRSWFISLLKIYFPDNVAGSSLRAGGASWLASLGASGDLIQAAGRWSSDTFKIYIRKHPLLLNNLLSTQISSTSKTS